VIPKLNAFASLSLVQMSENVGRLSGDCSQHLLMQVLM
jgi:hypothetical protein